MRKKEYSKYNFLNQNEIITDAETARNLTDIVDKILTKIILRDIDSGKATKSSTLVELSCDELPPEIIDNNDITSLINSYLSITRIHVPPPKKLKIMVAIFTKIAISGDGVVCFSINRDAIPYLFLSKSHDITKDLQIKLVP